MNKTLKTILGALGILAAAVAVFYFILLLTA